MSCIGCSDKGKTYSGPVVSVPPAKGKWPAMYGSETMPPARGWRFVDVTLGREMTFSGYSPGNVLEQVAAYRKNNGMEVDSECLRKELDDYWYGIEPDRYPSGYKPGRIERKTKTHEIKSGDVPMSFWGKSVWSGTALYFWGDDFDIGRFVSYWDEVSKKINWLCEKCGKHWAIFTEKHPYSGIRNREEALFWFASAINDVKKQSGIPELSMPQIKARFFIP